MQGYDKKFHKFSALPPQINKVYALKAHKEKFFRVYRQNTCHKTGPMGTFLW